MGDSGAENFKKFLNFSQNMPIFVKVEDFDAKISKLYITGRKTHFIQATFQNF